MMQLVRTTVTLDPDTEQIIRRRMRERGVSFKVALNDAIRSGVNQTISSPPFSTRTFSMGEPAVNLDRALQVAARLDDDHLIRKMTAGK